MTRAFVPVNQFIELANSEINKATESEVKLSDFDYGDKNKPIDMACRLVRWFTPEAVRAFKLIVETATNMGLYNEALQKHLKGSFPLFIFGKGPKEAKVFTGVVTTNLLESEEHSNAGSFCHRYVLAHNVLAPFYEKLGKELATPHTAKGWIGPGRAWKRVRKSENVDISYILNRILGLTDVIPQKSVAALAEAIEDLRKPIELIFADKPEDFVTMYASGPESCMSAKHNGSWEWMGAYGHTPTSFFSYHPHTRGVYVKKAGKVIARTIIYEVTKDKWEHGRVYTQSAQSGTSFGEALKNAGIKPLTHSAYAGMPKGIDKVEFTVPVFYAGGVPTSPVPYWDNLRAGIRFVMDTKDKATCTITRGEASGNGNGLGAQGYVRLDGITATCAECGGRCPANNWRRYENAEYCRDTCFGKAGLTAANNIDGVNVLAPKSTVYLDYYAEGQKYTTAEAAFRRGCKPVLDSLFYTNEEEDLYSRNGYNAVVGKQPVSANPELVMPKTMDSSGFFVLDKLVDITKIPENMFHTDVLKRVEYDPDAPFYTSDGPIPEVTVLEVTEIKDVPAKTLKKVAKSTEEEWFDVTYTDEYEAPGDRVRF